MITAKGLSPCVEVIGYYDNHHWPLWKLPMFGCTDTNQVLHEAAECMETYPQCYVRLVALNSVTQVQVMCFLLSAPVPEGVTQCATGHGLAPLLDLGAAGTNLSSWHCIAELAPPPPSLGDTSAGLHLALTPGTVLGAPG